MTWMVTGGAGYIGAHIVQAFTEADLPVVVLDSLSSGHREFVPDGVSLVVANVQDRATVARTLREHAVEGVIHLAGFKYAGVSVERPLHTYAENVNGMIALLQAMEDVGIGTVVFSSSAGVYGTVDTDQVTEQTPTRPESPYGESKLVGEWLIGDQARARGIRHTSLRYFNVVGSGSKELRDTSPHNLFPLAMSMLLRGEVPRINGDDYPTPDGTCIRDYIHVSDLALAHLEAAKKLTDATPLEPVYNLGSGDGVSVRQIMDTLRQVSAIDFTPVVGPRRPGDPARIVASGELAARDLGWQMRHTLIDMVRSAWQAELAAAPDGGSA